MSYLFKCDKCGKYFSFDNKSKIHRCDSCKTKLKRVFKINTYSDSHYEAYLRHEKNQIRESNNNFSERNDYMRQQHFLQNEKISYLMSQNENLELNKNDNNKN